MGSKKRSRSSKNKPETDEEGREEGATPALPAAAAAPTTERTSPPSRGDDDDDDDGGCGASGPGSPADDDRAARKAARKAAKLEIEKRVLSEIPTHDSDGIPYGRVQIRRMKRRVKHGLSPIPTEEEEREIRERERREREEEEKIYYANNDEDGDGGKEEASIVRRPRRRSGTSPSRPATSAWLARIRLLPPASMPILRRPIGSTTARSRRPKRAAIKSRRNCAACTIRRAARSSSGACRSIATRAR